MHVCLKIMLLNYLTLVNTKCWSYENMQILMLSFAHYYFLVYHYFCILPEGKQMTSTQIYSHITENASLEPAKYFSYKKDLDVIVRSKLGSMPLWSNENGRE